MSFGTKQNIFPKLNRYNRINFFMKSMISVDLCIINSPLFREFNPLYDEDSLPPLGLGYIATIAQSAGLSTVLIDAVAKRIPLKELISIVLELKVKAVGINIFTTNFELVKELVEAISNANTRIIIGGLSTRTLYKEIFGWQCSGFVDIVFGDGELIVPDLIRTQEKQKPDQVCGNMRFFSVTTESVYFCHDISSLWLDRSFFSNEPNMHRLGFIEAHLIASRGCIYNCSFCAAARSLNSDMAIRERSTVSLITEIQDIKSKFPNVSSIRVLDDLFLKNHHSIDNAIKVFGDSSLMWRSMAHVMTFNNVSLGKIQELRKSGCTELFIGVESGSPNILKKIHKTANIAKIKENLFKVLESGISLKCYFIYGFPGENEDDFNQTYNLAFQLKEKALSLGVGFRTSVFQFRPYHGTEIFHDLIDKEKEGEGKSNHLPIDGNPYLSSLVGRLQFNFHSGNYSNAPINILYDYIYKTANLSSPKEWGLE